MALAVDLGFIRVFRLDEENIGRLPPVRSVLYSRDHRLLLCRSPLGFLDRKFLQKRGIAFV